ncbi:hypothetical protein EXS72_00560 [Candidatus Pacearchaeota archaeon]|nr:hypothetical protein [Candidatus Pacearchaeota archaeon]
MNNAWLGLGVVGIIVAVAFFMFSGLTPSVNGNIVDEDILGNGESQTVVLSQEGLNYKDVSAEAGKPIKLSADSSVKGCLRSVAFNIDGKKYLKYLKSESDALVLPALKTGTYSFSCSMGMGIGTLVVD